MLSNLVPLSVASASSASSTLVYAHSREVESLSVEPVHEDLECLWLVLGQSYDHICSFVVHFSEQAALMKLEFPHIKALWT